MVLPKDFALAVVASSSSDLYVQEKFELYEEALAFADNKNKEKQSQKPKVDTIKKIQDLKKMGL